MNGIIGNRFPVEWIHRKSEVLRENGTGLCAVISSCSMTVCIGCLLGSSKRIAHRSFPMSLSPYFTPSSYNLFGCLKAVCSGILCCMDEEVQSRGAIKRILQHCHHGIGELRRCVLRNKELLVHYTNTGIL